MALTDIDGGRLADNAFSLGKNRIINGGMAVAQRGTTDTASGYGSVDRFLNDHGGGGAITQSQVALTSGTPYDEGFRYFYRQTNTTASTAAGRYVRVLQLIEAQNMAQSGWNYTSSSSYVTLSFWVRSSVAQEFYGVLNTKDGTSRNYPFSTGTLVADTWTKVTKTIPGDSNITFNNDNGNGLQVEFIPFYGTNFTDSGVTVDAWANYAGSSRVPDMTSTWANTTNATFDITGVQLEVGSQATPFEHRSYADELARCQRYYYRLAVGAGTVFFGPGFATGTQSAYSYFVLPTEMRDEPAVDTTGTASDYKIRRSVANITCSAVPTIAVRSKEGVALTLSVAGGLTAGEGILFRMDAAGVFIAFESEL